MIEDLEANFTGSPIDASNSDNSAMSEEANADEAIKAVAKDINDMEMDIE